MGKGKEGVLVVGNKNPIVQLKNNLEAFQTHLKILLRAPTEVVAEIVYGAIKGAALGFVTKGVAIILIYKHPCREELERHILDKRIMVNPGNLEASMGSYTAISGVMKRSRGKEDDITSLVTGFGAGAIYSMVSGVRG